MGELGVRFLGKASLRIFFSIFFPIFFLILSVKRMKRQLLGMIIIGLLVIWMMDATAGDPIPRGEKMDAVSANAEEIFRRLFRAKDSGKQRNAGIIGNGAITTAN